MKKILVYIMAFIMLSIFTIFSIIHIFNIIDNKSLNVKFIGVNAETLEIYTPDFDFNKYDPNLINETSTTEEKEWLTKYYIHKSSYEERNKYWNLNAHSIVININDIS